MYLVDGMIIQLDLLNLYLMNMFGLERKRIVNGKLGKLEHYGLNGLRMESQVDQVKMVNQVNLENQVSQDLMVIV
jgi:hypothetical protein